MLKYLILFLLLSGIATAQDQNISISFTPTFDRQKIEPVLIITLTNHGSELLTNVTVNLTTTGLDFNKVAFMNSDNFFTRQLAPEETQSVSYQFNYPNTKDDVIVRTDVHSDQGTYQVIFTIPAILMINLPSLPSASSLWILPVIGLVVTAILIIRKKRK